MRFLPSIVAAFSSLLIPAAASACSLVPGAYVPKDNLELVSKSDLIVIGRITGWADDNHHFASGLMKVEPIHTIRGNEPVGDIEVYGSLLPVGLAELSNPFQLAHAEFPGGSCRRDFFAIGSTVLFILQADDEGGVHGAPFSRWAEDVPMPNSPWEVVVRIYDEASKRADADRLTFLEEKRDAYAAQLDEPVSQLIANELSRQIMGNVAWERHIEEQRDAIFDAEINSGGSVAAEAIVSVEIYDEEMSVGDETEEVGE